MCPVAQLAGLLAWGSQTAQAYVYAAHDPVSLALALAGMPLYISYGNGEPGPLDDEETMGLGEMEKWIFSLNEIVVERLEELGIDVAVEIGPGTHAWPYFERGLHAAMLMLLEALGL